MSSVSQKKNPTTKNQLRKWEKKLRNAKTEEAKKKGGSLSMKDLMDLSGA